MVSVIRLRRGHAADWRLVDPVLSEGEPGFETDTGLHKIGDGVTRWADLPYCLDESALENRFARAPRTAAPAVGQGELLVNVRDAPYGAVGDGLTDDTNALQAALTAARGGICYVPPGTYLVSAAAGGILTPAEGTTLAGAGARLSVIRTAPGSLATRVVNVSGRAEVTVRDLGFDGGRNPTTRSGIHASTRDTRKRITVQRCRFVDFMPGDATTTHAAVYCWTTDGLQVLDNEFVDCGRAITVDQPDGEARIVGNRITATPGLMATGIFVRRSSGASEGEVLVHGNVVDGADRDPSGNGAEGHGIAVYRCQDVQITGNHCYGNGRGILVSYESFGAVVQGNTCAANYDAGIRAEPKISETSTTVGVDAVRGVTIVGNVTHHNAGRGTLSGGNTGIGITTSYAAGSVVSGNLSHHNTGDGIHCDSDRVTIVGNVSYNNFRGYTGDPVNGKRAGIRVYAGTGCTIVGNQCFDNQVTSTQHYGLSLSTPGTWHLVHGNAFAGHDLGEVWGTDKIREGFFGQAPVARPAAPGVATGSDAAVINAISDGLRQLGLFG
jgi:hypothetical protein